MKRQNLPPTEQEITEAMDTVRKLIDGGYLSDNASAEKLYAELEDALFEVAYDSGELEG